MKYWLVKSEPDTWSWQDQIDAKTTHWDGVRNHQASNNLKAMSKGDRALFYHSGKAREVVGIVEVTREYYPDPSDKSERFGMVDVKAVKALPEPVTLKAIKAEPKLAELALVRQPRLSVMPVDAAAWKRICAMGGLK
ncbi:MAG: EVE domain-containing protein [Phycisphaeraceae bacterium]